MRGIRLAGLFAFLVFAACDSTPVERASASCTVICSCMLPPVPSTQDACIDECVDDFVSNGLSISEECTTCISGHAKQCSTIELDCEPICELNNPPPQDDEPPPMPI